MNDLLQRLQRWYLANCDGDWEHSSGIAITTLDNPGWSIIINLEDTVLQDVTMERLSRKRSTTDWYEVFVRDGNWNGVGGAENLSDLLEEFLQWAERPTAGP